MNMVIVASPMTQGRYVLWHVADKRYVYKDNPDLQPDWELGELTRNGWKQ